MAIAAGTRLGRYEVRSMIGAGGMGEVYRAGDEKLSRELDERYARREGIGMYLAQVYAGFGDKDQVFAWLEKDFQTRSGVLPYITWWLNFDDLRSDPRYAELLR